MCATKEAVRSSVCACTVHAGLAGVHTERMSRYVPSTHNVWRQAAQQSEARRAGHAVADRDEEKREETASV